MSEKQENFDTTARGFEHRLQVDQLSVSSNQLAISSQTAESIKLIEKYVKAVEEKINVQKKSYLAEEALADIYDKLAKEETNREKRQKKQNEAATLHISALKEELKEVERGSSRYKELTAELEKYVRQVDESEKHTKKLGAAIKNVAKGTGDIVSSVDSLSKNYFDAAIQDFENYSTRINTRLGLSGNTFESLISNSFEAIGQSPIVDNKTLVANISELVNKGVASDVELMAFLKTVSESVATTFDAFDSNLLRLIRLQGQNNTAAYMGMEVALNDLFTSTFKDSSYLTNLRKTVSDSILDANAMLSADEGSEFSYVVQKWLGALSESGASDSFITELAKGINLLGTGNVRALSSNSQLQSLLAMSASRAGLNYADLLTGGLNASNTNALLASLLQYLQEVSNSSAGNNVLRSAYGGIFNFGTSDLRAIDNLFSSGAYNNIASQGLTASGAVGKLQGQINTAASRMPIAALFDNYMENLEYQAGMKVANSELQYVLYKLGDVIGKTFGDLEILGFGGKDVQAILQGSLQLLNTPVIGDALKDSLGLFTGDGKLGNITNVSKKLSNLANIFNDTDSLSGGLLDAMLGSATSIDLNAFKGFSRRNTLLGGESYAITGAEPLEEEDNPITWLKNIDKNTTNTDVKPIFTSDRTMKNSIEELEAKIESMKFHINLDSVNSDVILKTTVDYSSDAQRMIQNTALDLAKRMVSVIYSGSASSDDEKVSDEQNLKAFISSMLAVNEKGSGEAMNVNLAGSDLTIKDMLVRRV